MNPVLRKELRSMLRERRGWLVPVAYASVLAAAVFLFFVPARAADADAGALGATVAGIVAVLQTIAMCVLGPVVGAAAIAGERERGTWMRLLASRLPRWRIGLGKAAAATLYVMLMLSVSLPVAAVSLLFGATDAAVLGGLYLNHAVLGLAMACVGLALSTAFQRTWTAVLVSIGLALGLVIFTLAVFVALGGHEDRAPEWIQRVLYLNPGYGLGLFFGGDADAESGARWWGHLGALAGVGAVALAIALVRLRRMED